ncbi:helix-turn-helix transcriptional regulator [Bifidobacterium sp. MA2]|uniref:Helix-turn-helix transcriptional regulator n=1 Tax=Bifidobacterium santillanense TaxID=2809028 RepID=A0ABS5ULM3_9BIFI|nr:helix-turn-helix transcriptional regulator [Bifidobacterium santillanense]MBT1171802.1 helix-turn-helix transcriptional regulator [Bifidobacterium santillanense]
MGLRELRQKRGWTQRELADKAGVPYSRIADTERGARPIENMSLGMAVKIGDALRVSNLRKLLEDDGPKENTNE